jgi:hypothetical protein
MSVYTFKPALPAAKQDAHAATTPSNQTLSASELNSFVQNVGDLQTAIVSGAYFQVVATGTQPTVPMTQGGAVLYTDTTNNVGLAIDVGMTGGGAKAMSVRVSGTEVYSVSATAMTMSSPLYVQSIIPVTDLGTSIGAGTSRVNTCWINTIQLGGGGLNSNSEPTIPLYGGLSGTNGSILSAATGTFPLCDVNTLTVGGQTFIQSSVQVTGNLNIGGSVRTPDSTAAAIVGQATLIAGNVMVATTAVTAGSRIFATSAATASINTGFMTNSIIYPGVKFGLSSSLASDTSKVNWWVVN